MVLCARGLHWPPIPSRRGLPANRTLRLVESNAIEPTETRQSHRQSAAWRRIILAIQLLQRRQNIIQTQPVRNARDFAQGRMGFDNIHVRRPRRENHSLFICREFGIVQDVLGCVVVRYRVKEGLNVLDGAIDLAHLLSPFAPFVERRVDVSLGTKAAAMTSPPPRLRPPSS